MSAAKAKLEARLARAVRAMLNPERTEYQETTRRDGTVDVGGVEAARLREVRACLDALDALEIATAIDEASS